MQDWGPVSQVTAERGLEPAECKALSRDLRGQREVPAIQAPRVVPRTECIHTPSVSTQRSVVPRVAHISRITPNSSRPPCPPEPLRGPSTLLPLHVPPFRASSPSSQWLPCCPGKRRNSWGKCEAKHEGRAAPACRPPGYHREAQQDQ